eukprot:UN00650
MFNITNIDGERKIVKERDQDCRSEEEPSLRIEGLRTSEWEETSSPKEI